jgi:hypothetical protein
MKTLNNNTNYPMLPEGIRVEESHLIQEGRRREGTKKKHYSNLVCIRKE